MTEHPLTSPFDALLNQAADAENMALDYADLPAEQVVSGQARAGVRELARLSGCAVGIWEISPSVSTDVEADEIFLVLSGEATITFADGSPDMALRAGTIGRLIEGARTTWNVKQTLRKVYVAVRP